MSTRRIVSAVAPLILLASLAAHVAAQASQQSSVTGRVTDAATGQPVAAAQIRVAGSTLGTQTNTEGHYTLRGVTAGRVQLLALRVGYGEQRQTVDVAAGQAATADFQMRAVPITLSPVVTTATGEQLRTEVGNSIAQVNAAEIAQTRAAANNVADMLTARAPGVQVLSGVQGCASAVPARCR